MKSRNVQTFQPLVVKSDGQFFNPTFNMDDVRMPTAEETIKKLIAEVKAEKEKEKTQKELIIDETKIEKCQIHPKKFSQNCRTCRKIKEQIEQLEHQRKMELERTNPEARLREILGTNALPQEQVHKKSKFPNTPLQIWGDASTFNMNEMLRQNIKNSQYFSDLQGSKFEDVIDQIATKSNHAEPWTAGGIPSTLFCCLYKLMLMRLTEAQIKEMLDYEESPYVRCAAFLYLRYCCQPERLWDWFGDYLLDERELRPSLDPNYTTTMGEYVENLLLDMSYYSTRFPRIPVVQDRDIKKNILLQKDKREKRRTNKEIIHKFAKGVRVSVLSPEDNDWHDATLVNLEGYNVRVKFDEKKLNDIEALEQLQQKFEGKKTFIGGNEIDVDLGEVILNVDSLDEPIENKETKMDEEQEAYGSVKEERQNGSVRSSSPSSRSSSRSRSKKRHHKRHSSRRKKHHDKRSRHRRSRSSSSESSSRSTSRSRDRDRKHRRDRHKKRPSRRSESSSESSSESRSKSRSRSKQKEAKKPEIKAPKEPQKSKEQSLMERVKQMESDRATAKSKHDYAARVMSVKTSISTNMPTGSKKKRSSSKSPKKAIVHVVQDMPKGYKPETEKKVQDVDAQKAAERMKKLKEQYGSSSPKGDKQDRPRDVEGPEVFKLGNY